MRVDPPHVQSQRIGLPSATVEEVMIALILINDVVGREC
jgi:hypothetical protein